MLAPPVSAPAGSYDEGMARLRPIMDRDDERIARNARTALYLHGTRAPWSVVLFHGFTNHPGQYVDFAPELYVLGANVVVPRMPFHGYADRMTDALKALTAEMLIATAYEAVDAAAGLGERVAVAGISMGGSISAYLAQYRADVATSMPIAPDFGLLKLPRWALDVLCPVVLALPNVFFWWDPRIKEKQVPKTAYPRFPTHALMQTVRIGSAVYRAANHEPARAARIATVVNTHDPAVSNSVTLEVVRRWQRFRSSGIEYIELTDLPENHDIIDPENPQARTGLVYPKLIDALAIC
jgi:alpha-beta hydrolase superfamily lysophospholipase